MTSQQSILIVEDEPNLGLTLKEYLGGKGYDAHLAKSVKEANELFKEQTPDVVLMDIGLPDGSGLDLAKGMREIRQDFLLLFLSALNDPDTKVEGLEIGAEDYITKPFALKELNLRLERSLKLKESLTSSDTEVTYGPFTLAFSRFQVINQNGPTHELGQKDCALLKLLHDQKGEVCSREDIIDKIWGEDKFPSNRTVDNYIVKLRRLFETDPLSHIEIQSVRGIGYKLITKN
jgi:two-component system alkaline phosphatase synthesis response regulator PhoP